MKLKHCRAELFYLLLSCQIDSLRHQGQQFVIHLLCAVHGTPIQVKVVRDHDLWVNKLSTLW